MWDFMIIQQHMEINHPEVPIPQGEISAIPYPLPKAFDLVIAVLGWKMTGLAVVGEKIHRRYLEIVEFV